jgi:hypothetical protein
MNKPPTVSPAGFKPKDLVPIPWMVAMALQEPYEHHLINRPEDRAWLAGLIDGDGCMGIRRQKHSGNRSTEWAPSYIPYLTIKMSDRQALDKVIAITRYGHIRQEDGRTDKRGIKTNRVSNKWRLDGNKAVAVIRDIYPYLLVKRRQACVIHTLDISNKSTANRGSYKVPKDIIVQRQHLYELVKGLNQRNIEELPSWIEEPKTVVEPGWWLRSSVVWAKGLSFATHEAECPHCHHKFDTQYSGSCMPESVRDRPTQSYEYVFLLAKSKRYFYDQEAVREPAEYGRREWSNVHAVLQTEPGRSRGKSPIRSQATVSGGDPSAGRNLRSVWAINPHPFPEAHFATFPPKLVEPCILAGTSAKGVCPECGGPWERVLGPSKLPTDRTDYQGKADAVDSQHNVRRLRALAKTSRAHGLDHDHPDYSRSTLGWQPTCACGRDDVVPAVVLDPFMGSGTVAKVALEHHRNYIGIDLQPDYVEMANRRICTVQPRLLL